MFANKCDRCGAFYVPADEVRVFTIHKRMFPSNILLDLCPKCYEDLMDFMANPDMVSVYFKCQEEEGLGVE